MTITLYDRRCVLTVGKLPPADNYVLQVPDALQVEGLRVTFKITRDAKPQPNTGEFTIFNLSESSRAELQGKGFRVILQAGYGDQVAQIFSGDVRAFAHSHEGPDWITSVQAGDGERAYARARVSQSWRPGVQVRDVVAGTIKALQVDPGNALKRAQELAGEFSSGYVQHANASLELSRLLEPFDLGWSIQDGRLEILGPGEVLPDAPPLVSPDTGLIGSPTVAAPTKRGDPFTLKVKSLLMPGMRPGRSFTLSSATRSGTFRAVKVTHTGDTHGGEWYTEIEANTHGG